MHRWLALTALVACGSPAETDRRGPDDTESDADTDADSDSDTDADSDADSDTDTDSDADRHPFSVAWDGGGVTVSVADPAVTGFALGLAETGAGAEGWYGEDCLAGTASWRLCHDFTGREGRLDSVYPDIDEVIEGVTTLFPQTLAPDITYVVRTDAGDCWVYGQDPTYYTGSAAFSDCAPLPP